MSNPNEPVHPDHQNKHLLHPGATYPVSEDIYIRSQKEADIDPEKIDTLKTPNEPEETAPLTESGFEEDQTGAGLDIPGTELDDEEEAIGSEDEENNYYSIGGDNHNDLDEEKSE